jgi:crossover junction endodeoxyribonuclease RusA
MSEVNFTVRGTPAPQGSKRALVHRSTGRAVVMESAGQGLKDWRADVKAAAFNAGPADLLTGPLMVSVIFTLPKPKSAPKSRKWPDRRPDLDKLLRAALDAMTGVVFADDAQVVGVEAWKGYPGEMVAGQMVPGARIIVKTLKED